MVLTEMDDVGGVIVMSALVMLVLFVLAVYTERWLTGSPPSPSARDAPAAVRTVVRPAQGLGGAVVWLTTLLAVGSFAMLLLVLSGATLDLDGATLPVFTALDGTVVGHVVARTLVMGGQMWLVGSGLAAAAAWHSWTTRSPRALWACGCGLGAMSVTLWGMKVLSARSAPHSLENSVLHHGMSYPSGHTAAATFCLPLILVLLSSMPRPVRIPRPVLTGVGGAGVVGICTMVLGYHWLTDVVGGWLVAATFTVPVLALIRHPTRIMAREDTARSPR